MRSNSRPVTSNQTGPHEQLTALVKKHADTGFLKPLSDNSLSAFEYSIAVWRNHGSKPLIIDAGCGVGLSTRRLATQYPDHFVIGIDQSADRLERAVQWDGKLPENYLTVRADLVDYWRLMLKHAIHPEQHYLLYPNPWPKKDQLIRRWHGHPVFPVIIALGGRIECRSNWEIYIAEFAAAAGQLSGQVTDYQAHIIDSSAALTPFEEKYAASGHGLWRCEIQLSAADKAR